MSSKKRKGYLFCKRLADVFFSVLFLLLTLFPMLLLCLIKWLAQKQFPLFLQTRLGRDKKPFTLLKIRTMDVQGRTNEFDRLLRRYSIDEIPQLINILLGQMSFVGFRPVIPLETELIRLRSERGVYEMRPGLTGWAQINGRDTVHPKEKAELDQYYLEHCSIALDGKILLRTIGCVLTHQGVQEK